MIIDRNGKESVSFCFLSAGYGFTPDSMPELEVFFFHTDHLGSTSYLTDSAGSVCQFVCYTPYGEAFVDEHTTTYENPFKFSGKELDDVTGLYDHWMRQRNPVATLWLTPDPLRDFYPDFSPYHYCYGNPVKFIDRFGMEGEETDQGIMLPEVVVEAKRPNYLFYQLPQSYLSHTQSMQQFQTSQRMMQEQNSNASNMLHNAGNWCNFSTNAISLFKNKYDYLYKYDLSYHCKGISSINTTKFFGLSFGRGALRSARPMVSLLGKAAPFISYGAIVNDIRTQGPKAHQVADATITTGLLYLSVVNPVAGLAVSLIYFTADLTCQYYTGKTLTEQFIDPAAEYVYDAAVDAYDDVSW